MITAACLLYGIMHNTDIEELQSRIGYHFKNTEYLYVALTHSSFSNEMKINRCDDYERQEFLGDAVLELVSSDCLYRSNPDKPEGGLTRMRASMVCEPALAYRARKVGLQEFIRLGRGEEATGGRDRDSITSDVLEALIGGIYLDSGFESASDFINEYILKDPNENMLFYDAKSTLQERVQHLGKQLEYVVVEESGPAHDKSFAVEALIDGTVAGRGEGHTKKAAQQNAAVEVLRSNKCI